MIYSVAIRFLTLELPNGNVRTEYVSTRRDDWGHSEVYLAAAFQLLWRAAGMRAIAELEATPVPLLEATGDNYDQYGLGPSRRQP